MACDKINNLISADDFDCVGMVATHCNLDKLCIAINEAQDFDMADQFCDCWLEIINIWKELEPESEGWENDLICGGLYTGCNKKLQSHFGIKRILVYFAYARYLMINGFNDTATGIVTKQSEWSLPKPQKEIQAFADKYRNMAVQAANRTKAYICSIKDDFTCGDCKACRCDHCKGRKSGNTKGYGWSGSIISKHI